MSPQGYKNMDLESQDPIFNANLGQDENLIWTKKLRCSHSIRRIQNGGFGVTSTLGIFWGRDFSEHPQTPDTLLQWRNSLFPEANTSAQSPELAIFESNPILWKITVHPFGIHQHSHTIHCPNQKAKWNFLSFIFICAECTEPNYNHWWISRQD